MTEEHPATSIPWLLRRPMRLALRAFSRLNVLVYRLSNGRLMSRLPQDAPVCLVTMTGRRSGRKLTIPLIHVARGEEVILIASQGGLDRHPLWYYNLKANPEVGITANGFTRRMLARELHGPEKASAWAFATRVYAEFDVYQARTDRDIPLFLCRPVT